MNYFRNNIYINTYHLTGSVLRHPPCPIVRQKHKTISHCSDLAAKGTVLSESLRVTKMLNNEKQHRNVNLISQI